MANVAQKKLRKIWSEVSMATTGKITTHQLREFQVNFFACADEVKDANPPGNAPYGDAKITAIHEGLDH